MPRTSAPNWVGTRVPLRFWTNGTVISAFFDDFYRFLTWMVSDRLPSHNDYKLNNNLCDLTSQKQNQVSQSRCCNLC